MLMEDPGGTSNNVCRFPMLMADPGGTSNKCL